MPARKASWTSSPTSRRDRRPVTERRSPVLGGRTVAKVVGAAYLTRKGGTEFEQRQLWELPADER